MKKIFQFVILFLLIQINTKIFAEDPVPYYKNCGECCSSVGQFIATPYTDAKEDYDNLKNEHRHLTCHCVLGIGPVLAFIWDKDKHFKGFIFSIGGGIRFGLSWGRSNLSYYDKPQGYSYGCCSRDWTKDNETAAFGPACGFSLDQI